MKQLQSKCFLGFTVPGRPGSPGEPIKSIGFEGPGIPLKPGSPFMPGRPQEPRAPSGPGAPVNNNFVNLFIQVYWLNVCSSSSSRYMVIYLSVKVCMFVFMCYPVGLEVLSFQAILLVHILVSHLVQGLL